MSAQVHVLRLGPRRRYGSYYDKKTGLYLTYPERVEGTVPFGADLSNLYISVKMEQLEDVNGTLVAEYERTLAAHKAEESGEKASTVTAVVKEEPVAEPVPTKTEESTPATDVPEEQAPEVKTATKRGKKK